MPQRYSSPVKLCTIFAKFVLVQSALEYTGHVDFITKVLEQNRYIRQVGPNMISKEMCYEAVEKDFAFVTIDLRNNYVRMRRDIKISFLNRVGTIGN